MVTSADRCLHATRKSEQRGDYIRFEALWCYLCHLWMFAVVPATLSSVAFVLGLAKYLNSIFSRSLEVQLEAVAADDEAGTAFRRLHLIEAATLHYLFVSSLSHML
jgi:hypothetical protein